MVNTLLTELDGLSARKQVYVVGATNRPDILDPAMCRPGRLDKLLYVDLPSAAERVEILRTLTRKTPLGGDVDLERVAMSERADGFSGADLSALVREAAQTALRAYLTRSLASSSSSTGLASDHGMMASDEGEGDPLANEEISITVDMAHFNTALEKTTPSVSKAQRKRFEALRLKMSGLPVGHAKERLPAPSTAGVGAAADSGGDEAPSRDEEQPTMST